MLPGPVGQVAWAGAGSSSCTTHPTARVQPPAHGLEGGRDWSLFAGLYLLGLVPGEGDVELGEGSLLVELGKLLSVQVVLVLMATAIVQHRLANGLPWDPTGQLSAHPRHLHMAG